LRSSPNDSLAVPIPAGRLKNDLPIDNPENLDLKGKLKFEQGENVTNW
jgi:hypothetical protein